MAWVGTGFVRAPLQLDLSPVSLFAPKSQLLSSVFRCWKKRMERKAQHWLQTNLLIIILRWKTTRDPLVPE